MLSLVVHTHHLSATYSYHRWTNKKPCRKKLLSFLCYDVYQCIVVLSILCILCLGDRESSVTPIEVCQDWNPTVTVARQDFRKCAYAPMHLIMEYLCVPYAWHAWLQQPHLWVCSQTFCSPRCENSPSLRRTLYWVHGMFLLTTMWPPGNILTSVSWC